MKSSRGVMNMTRVPPVPAKSTIGDHHVKRLHQA